MRRLRVFFMGTPALAVPTLDTIAEEHQLVGIATQPDRHRGRGRKVQISAVKRWASAHGIPVVQPLTLREESALEPIAATQPDAIVVVAYGLILPPSVLDLPSLGCVNVHASLLPRHRGASPIQAAILAGDSLTGVTTMLMDEGLDTGPILMQRETSVSAEDTAATLGDRLARIGAELLGETLRGLGAGTIVPRPQDGEAATMTRLIRKQDGRIDWTLRGAEIDRRVRAMQPWPSAWTEWRGTRLQIWKVEPGPEPAGGGPGHVQRADSELVVECGCGSIRVLELQRAGGKRLAAADFLRGARLEPGERLGVSS